MAWNKSVSECFESYESTYHGDVECRAYEDRHRGGSIAVSSDERGDETHHSVTSHGYTIASGAVG
jgi:hypothetical protein